MTYDTAERSAARPRPGSGAGRRARAAAWVLVPLAVYGAVTVVMFWNGRAFGMAFDEVSRANNVWVWLNPDAVPQQQEVSSLTIFGHMVPLMFKTYVSAALVPWYLPLGLFADPLTGIRLLYAIYTFAGAATGFLAFRRLWYWPATVVPLLCLTSPLMYPEVLYGFVTVLHVMPLIISARLVVGYFRSGSRWALFGAAAFAGLAINISFYSAWVVVGLGVSFVIVNPRRAWSAVRHWRNLVAVVAGAAIGLFNYVYYNVTQGFPTVRVFTDRIFALDAYNEHAIDGVASQGVLTEVGERLGLLPRYMDGVGPVAVALWAGCLAVCAAVAFTAIRTRSWASYRWYFLPVIGAVIAFGAILISPNADRAGHFGMLVGVIESALVCTYLMAAKAFGPAIPALRRRALPAILVGVLACTGALSSRVAIDRELRIGGRNEHSTAIFGLVDYVLDNVPSSQLLQVQWGSYSQLFFFTRGEYATPGVVFQVLYEPMDERVRIIADAVREHGGDMVVPVYLMKDPVHGDLDFSWAADAVEETARALGGALCVEETFARADGREDIVLYRIRTGEVAQADPLPTCESFAAPSPDPSR
ncbi:MAG: hypothetical protein LBK59_00250 [Bifidobacteriaceae bacterium]|nr:hypothetical protein [Bifidobacteriaceae bacterium]